MLDALMVLTGVIFKKAEEKFFSTRRFNLDYVHFIDASNNLSGNKYIRIQDDTSSDGQHLLFMKEGSGSIFLEDLIHGHDREYDLEKGDRILIPNYVAYTITLLNGSKALKLGEGRESGFSNMYEKNSDYNLN